MDTANQITMNDGARTMPALDLYSEVLKTNHSDAFAFREKEQLALDLYDQLRDLELQQSLLKAQREAVVPDLSELSDDHVREQLIVAEREAMDARAQYELRVRITHNVITMDPILKAVHGGENTGYAEKRLLPLVHEEDAVSMLNGACNSRLQTLAQALSAAEHKNILASRENIECSKVLLRLAEDLQRQSAEDIEDPHLRGQVFAVEKSVKESRRRTRALKGIVSGMIVGSGIDWAEDEQLLKLVMDDEDG